MSAELENQPTVTASEVRKNIASYIDRAWKKSERIPITKHGKAVAAIVPYADLEALEFEDRSIAAEWDDERNQIRGGERKCAESEREGEPGSERMAIGAEASRLGELLPYLLGKISARLADASLNIGRQHEIKIQKLVERSLVETINANTVLAEAALVGLPPAVRFESSKGSVAVKLRDSATVGVDGDPVHVDINGVVHHGWVPVSAFANPGHTSRDELFLHGTAEAFPISGKANRGRNFARSRRKFVKLSSRPKTEPK